jgi:hypothetical protein
MCLLSRCVNNSTELFDQELVINLSNIKLLLGFSIYLDCKWVEDCPLGNDHWARILRCTPQRMLVIEQMFHRLIKYRLYVSDDETNKLEQTINNTYSSHITVMLTDQVEEDMDKLIEELLTLDNENESLNLLCTEMFVDVGIETPHH